MYIYRERSSRYGKKIKQRSSYTPYHSNILTDSTPTPPLTYRSYSRCSTFQLPPLVFGDFRSTWTPTARLRPVRPISSLPGRRLRLHSTPRDRIYFPPSSYATIDILLRFHHSGRRPSPHISLYRWLCLRHLTHGIAGNWKHVSVRTGFRMIENISGCTHGCS